MYKKQFLTITLTATLLTSTTHATTLLINDQAVTAATTTRDGATLVPARTVADALGASLWWDGDSESLYIYKEETTIKLTIGSLQANIDGRYIALPTPPIIVNETTMIPLRIVAEAFGVPCEYDSITDTIFINSYQTFETIEHFAADEIIDLDNAKLQVCYLTGIEFWRLEYEGISEDEGHILGDPMTNYYVYSGGKTLVYMHMVHGRAYCISEDGLVHEYQFDEKTISYEDIPGGVTVNLAAEILEQRLGPDDYLYEGTRIGGNYVNESDRNFYIFSATNNLGKYYVDTKSGKTYYAAGMNWGTIENFLYREDM
ncbi:MAG: hypothetical protein ATN35_05975 [Epulopiscium sp. Nele67-Bin004]|nr:MAG: hypothetical protein ATN35_05975 [Epulopiscium sp. Nele67-Bin004]